MKTTIDTLEVTTGWACAGGTIAVSLNQHPEYIADNLAASLLIQVPAGNINKVLKKTVSVTLTDCTEIVFNVWSRGKGSVNQPGMLPPMPYKIKFGTNEFYIPLSKGFNDVSIGLNGWTAVTEISITPLFDDDDYLIISGMYGIRDEYPADVFAGVKAGIERAVSTLSPKGLLVGTCSCVAGETSIALSAYTYIDRFATILIDDGANSETHQIEKFDEGATKRLWFTSLKDGKAIKYNHTTAPVYLALPVEYGTMQKEAIIPGIAIWGMESTPDQNEVDSNEIWDTYNVNGSTALRRTVYRQKYQVLIDCEARHGKVLAVLSRLVKWFISQQVVWINGRKHDIGYGNAAVYIEPPESVEMVPKLQYTIEIQTAEERNLRTFAHEASTATLVVDALPVSEATVY